MYIYISLSSPIRLGGVEGCGEVINKSSTPPPHNNQEVLKFFNWLWRESLFATDHVLKNVLGMMYWILYWIMYWGLWIILLAAFVVFSFPFTFFMSFHFLITFWVYLGLSPLWVTVTTGIITFLVGNPNLNLHLPRLLLGGGTTQRISTHQPSPNLCDLLMLNLLLSQRRRCVASFMENLPRILFWREGCIHHQTMMIFVEGNQDWNIVIGCCSKFWTI